MQKGEKNGEIGGVTLQIDKLVEYNENIIGDDLFIIMLELNNAIPEFFESTLNMSVNDTIILDHDIASVVCHQNWEKLGVVHYPSQCEWQQWYPYLPIDIEKIESAQDHARRMRVLRIYTNYIDYVNGGIVFDVNWQQIKCEIVQLLIFGKSGSIEYFNRITVEIQSNINLQEQFSNAKDIFGKLKCKEITLNQIRKYFSVNAGVNVVNFCNRYF